MDNQSWHLVGQELRDGSPTPANGEWLVYDGELALCNSGLHSSERAIDTLSHIPYMATHMCRVTYGGEVIFGTGKLVSSKRRIDWRVPVKFVFSAFARWCALQVVHMWPAPPEQIEWLRTGGRVNFHHTSGLDKHIKPDPSVGIIAMDEAKEAFDYAFMAVRISTLRSQHVLLGRFSYLGMACDAARSACNALAYRASKSEYYSKVLAGRVFDYAEAMQNDQLEKMLLEAHEGKTEWVFE